MLIDLAILIRSPVRTSNIGCSSSDLICTSAEIIQSFPIFTTEPSTEVMVTGDVVVTKSPISIEASSPTLRNPPNPCNPFPIRIVALLQSNLNTVPRIRLTVGSKINLLLDPKKCTFTPGIGVPANSITLPLLSSYSSINSSINSIQPFPDAFPAFIIRVNI